MKHLARSPKQLGAALLQARTQRGLSQQDLASLIGTYQKTISSVENGNPGVRLETMFQLLAALQLDLQIVPRRKADNDLETLF